MILRFATKRDVNGNRLYLIVDTDKKEYSRHNSKWFHRDDFIQVGKQDMVKILYETAGNGEYEEVDNI